MTGTTGKRSSSDVHYHDFYGDAVDKQILAEVSAIATRRKVSPSEVALAWVRQNPDICCPIIGASRLAHLEQALQALNLMLDPDELERLDTLYRPRDVICDQVVNPRQRYAEPSLS